MTSILALRKEIAACTHCAAHCPAGCRPLVQLGARARLLIIGQAPGRRAHESGIPWNDPSGNRLRSWLELSRDEFYDESRVALMPMGFCYPGTGASGDLPPRPECAPLWHDRVLAALPAIQLTILIGRYATARYGGALADMPLSESVRQSGHAGPWILPHPSPRNQGWMAREPWFERETLPRLRDALKKLR